MLLLWTDNLSVGIDQFDEDHKRLIAIINELHCSIQAARAKGEIDKTEIEIALHLLQNYIRYHCDREELFMAKTGYPELESHRQEHRRLEAKIADMAGRFQDSTDPEHAAEIMQFIFDWLTNHIFVVDRQYSSHLRANGLFDDLVDEMEPAGAFSQ
jgi:hemerythrin-like metal-binding protein